MTFPFDPREELMEPPGLRASESLAGTFRDNADLLLKLMEMQATLEGSFHRAVHELQRMQRVRKEREEKAKARRAKTA